MRREIPAPVLSVCADVVARRESHATLESLFGYAGAPGDPPPGSKVAKATAWLRITNKDESVEPLTVLGRLIENYMDGQLEPHDLLYKEHTQDREKISKALARANLQYASGGRVTGSLASPSRNLEHFLRQRDVEAIGAEFDRALGNVEISPREAVSAASNILESLCKIYIDDEELTKPNKLDLNSVWQVVRKDLGFDPSQIQDQDLQRILSGLLSVVDGIGALRTHASSAHGQGKKSYKLEARHARLAVHAAHTVTLFVLETWDKKKSKKQ